MLEGLAGQFPAIHREHASPAFACAWPVVFKVEHEGMLARLERPA